MHKKLKIENSGGFTFLELVIVMVIISVVLSLSAPRLQGFYRGVKLDSTARQLKMFLTYAREVAVSEKKTLRVKVEAGWRRLLLMEPPGEDGTGGEFIEVSARFSSYKIRSDIFIKEIKNSDGDASLNSEYLIEIHPLFSSEEISFLLADLEDNKVKVTIEAGGGLVVIGFPGKQVK